MKWLRTEDVEITRDEAMGHFAGGMRMRANRAWIYCRAAGACETDLDAMRMQRRRLERHAAQHTMTASAGNF